MSFKFTNDKPIFMQLADILKGLIVSGRFKVNDKLPSVREFALEYSINPNTVQKALQILEEDGLIITDRTNGKYVADNENVIKQEKSKLIKIEVDTFFKKMQSLGLDEEEIKSIINEVRE